MGQVTISIGGRDHVIGCRDGEEGHIRRLGLMLDSHAETAIRAAGGNNERMMLLIALILADALDEAQNSPSTGVPVAVLDRLADRLEALASALEEAPPAS